MTHDHIKEERAKEKRIFIAKIKLITGVILLILVCIWMLTVAVKLRSERERQLIIDELHSEIR